jgi:hypothetical protein
MSSRHDRQSDYGQLELDLRWGAPPPLNRQGGPRPPGLRGMDARTPAQSPRDALSDEPAPRGSSRATVELDTLSDGPATAPGRRPRLEAGRVADSAAEQPQVNNGALTRAEFIAQIVEAAPPLSPSQKHRLLALLQQRKVA